MDQQYKDQSIMGSSDLDDFSKSYLLETVRWTKFLAILGFIGTGMMVFAALIFMTVGGVLSSMTSSLSGLGILGSVGIGIFYLAFAFLYFYPVLCLYRFTTNMKSGIATGNQMQVTEAFRYQRNMYRFMGILAIVVISIYILLFVFGGLFATMGR